MAEVLENQELNKPRRDELGRILPGSTGNPNGRPKGKTLKEFAREHLMNLPDEEKTAYLAELPKDIVWRMAEGNPHQTSEIEAEVTLPKPLLNALRHNIGDQENRRDEQTDSSDPGRNISG